MTTLSIISGGYILGIATTANSTTYVPISAYPASSQLETDRQTIFRSAGTLQNLYVRIITNSCNASITYSTRKNNATNGNGTVSVATTTTGEFEDTTHTDAVVAGDTWTVRILPGGGSTGTNTISVIRLLFSATTNTVTRFTVISDSATSAVSTTYYFPIAGFWDNANTTEGVVQCAQRLAGTMQHLAYNVSGNTRTAAVTGVSRVGGLNGNLSVSITAATTGIFEDTTHSDTISAGNLFCTALTFGSDASKSLVLRTTHLSFISTAGYNQCCAANTPASSPGSTGQLYNVLSGAITPFGGTESQAQMKASQAMQFSQLTIRLSANTSGGAGTLVFRKNAGNAKQTASVPANTTGVFTDTTNVDYVISSDELDYGFAAGATSGTSYVHLSCWAVAGTAASISETTAVSDATPKRLIGRKATPVFAHTYN